MWILAYFSDSGVPKLGLTPTILIRDLSDNSITVNNESMSEVGSGFYKYKFLGFINTKEYAIQCDGGVALVDTDRYTYGSNEDVLEIESIGQWLESRL